MNEILLRYLLLHNLIELAEAYGISYPTLIKASKQLGQLVTGTMLAEVLNSGLRWDLFAQAIIDTRSLHFWVLSSTNPHTFIIRFCQYAALETVRISFGHLNNGAGAIAIGGFRNFVAQNLAPTIFYNSTRIKAVMGVEKNAIAIAALVGKKGRSVLPVIFKLMGGHQDEYVKPIVLKPVHARTIAFQNDCKIIIENMFQEHAMRRALNSPARRIYNNPSLVPTVFSVTSSSYLNVLPILGWSIFGLTVTVGSVVFALHIFQRGERNRWHSQNDGVIIDVSTSFSE